MSREQRSGVRGPLQLVLASSSPIRREMLALLGVPFGFAHPEVDETREEGEEASQYVERVARAKAKAAAEPNTVVLAADTIVVLDGQVLGKPAGPERARGMLRLLAGRSHGVLTGVAVATWANGVPVVISLVETTVVHFTAMTEAEIDWYVATEEPLDKAGSYAVQGRGALFIESLAGSPSNVMGLPMAVTLRLLRQAGLESMGA